MSLVDRNGKEVFASFRLGKTELAISIGFLQEVVPCPSAFLPVPLAPAYLVGLFNLRGIVVPIVDAAVILQTPAAEDKSEKRIAVVEQGGVRIGLLFDATSEILPVAAADISVFGEGENGPHGAIKGALKLNGGERILQILDPAALLKIDTIPQVKCEKESVRKKAKRNQCITFSAGAMRFALSMTAIREIIKVPEIHPSHLNYDYSLGMIHLRGKIMPLVDLAKFLGVQPSAAEEPENYRIIVLQIEGSLFGFRVGGVENIVAYFEEELLPIPLFEHKKPEMFRGLLSNAQTGEAIYLDESKILGHEEVKHLTQGHSNLYGEGEEKKKEARSARRTFLNFRLDSLFSVPLGQVDEIANCASGMLKPPGYPEFVTGVFKMRGEAITVIDLRRFYGLTPATDTAEAKLLILKGRNGKYGLLVDSVESICHVSDTEKVKIPSLMHSDLARAVEADMSEVAEMKDASGKARTYLVIDLTKVLGRLEAPAA